MCVWVQSRLIENARMTALKSSSSSEIAPNPAILALARAIGRFAQSDGDCQTVIPGLSLYRRQSPTEPLPCIFKLGLGVVAQGHKQALLGSEVIQYGPGQSMLTTIELPVSSHVTCATSQEPLLGLMLTFDSVEIAQAAADMQLPVAGRTAANRSIAVERLDESLAWALVRLVELLDQAPLVAPLAPLIKREIIIRVLAGPHGAQLLHLLAEGSPSQQISRAVSWLKHHFAQDMKVDELAARVHMSPSTFRQHFRTMTGTSPLQYQKQLRLQQARYLMLDHNIDAGTAGSQVGYQSASQFSREYHRLFGLPPQQDVRRMRMRMTEERPAVGPWPMAHAVAH